MIDGHRKLPIFLAVTVCTAFALIVSLAACGGGRSGGTNVGADNAESSSTTLGGGTSIGGRTILFEIKSTPGNSFFVPVVNGVKAAAAIAGVKLQISMAAMMTRRLSTR